MNKTKGFTIIEIIIVLAIIVVISAIITPNLVASAEISTLKSDIQSAKTIDNAIGIYTANGGVIDDDLSDAIDELIAGSYLKPSARIPQIAGATWVYEEMVQSGTQKIVKLDLGTGSKYSSLLSSLSNGDVMYIKGNYYTEDDDTSESPQ